MNLPKNKYWWRYALKKHIYSMKHESIRCGEAIRTVDDSSFLLSNCATEIMATCKDCKMLEGGNTRKQ